MVIDGRPRGYVLITGDPAEEIARAWRDIRDLMALAAAAAVLQAALIAGALAQGLRPVATIAARLSDMTRGDLDSRIGPLPIPTWRRWPPMPTGWRRRWNRPAPTAPACSTR